MATKVKSVKVINWWLIAGACMLAVQIVLGGITRLTGSGLSITEWQPLLGIFPPVNEQSWQRSFHGYQQIAQFKKLNNHFSLANYKHIFFWEWFHREWARLIALVFIVPFIVFIWKRWIDRRLAFHLAVLFLLGALQGLIGWIMVKTGLNDTATAVHPVALAVHFISAVGLFSYLVLIIMSRVRLNNPAASVRGSAKMSVLIIVLLLTQLVFGAFMSGTHAALYAPTWPDMNGEWVPRQLFAHPIPLPIILKPLVVQFIHRGLAYLIAVLIIIWFLNTYQRHRGSALSPVIMLPPLLVITQVVLGVFTLLNSAGSNLIWYAAAHQLTAILLLASVLVTARLSSAK